MCHPEVPPGLPLPDVKVEEVRIDVGVGQMPGILALPERTPAPAVLVVNDVLGKLDFYEHLTRRIAQAGFIALDVEYFFREGPVAANDRDAASARREKLVQRRTLGDLDSALSFLGSRSDVRGGRLGTIGFCMGGTFVLDLAASRGDLATVSYYGFPAAERPNLPSPLEVADRMSPPILAHWGDQDHGAGMDNVRALDEKLTAAGVFHEFHIYPNLGHGFLRAFLDEETVPGHDAACESWKRTLDFWRKHLGEELEGREEWDHGKRPHHHDAEHR